jgi:hypothetical protein
MILMEVENRETKEENMGGDCLPGKIILSYEN